MTRKDAIDTLVTAIMERDYGEMLTFAEIGKIIQHKYDYRDILQAARKRLIEAGRMIVNVRGVGYKVCEPDDYTGVGIGYMRRGVRKIDRGAKIVRYAPVSDMSPEARAAHNRVNDKLTRVQAALAGASVELHMLSVPENPLSLMKSGGAR